MITDISNYPIINSDLITDIQVRRINVLASPAATEFFVSDKFHTNVYTAEVYALLLQNSLDNKLCNYFSCQTAHTSFYKKIASRLFLFSKSGLAICLYIGTYYLLLTTFTDELLFHRSQFLKH